MFLLCVVSFYFYDRDNIKKSKKIEKETLINGKIVDITNDIPIDGVSISIAGTPKSLSNANGEYAVVARGDQELLFKHAKYKSIIIMAKDAKAIKMEAKSAEDTKKALEKFEEAE